MLVRQEFRLLTLLVLICDSLGIAYHYKQNSIRIMECQAYVYNYDKTSTYFVRTVDNSLVYLLNRSTRAFKSLARYGFGGNREEAIKRDGYACVECGMSRDEHKAKYKRDISVDHIDGSGRNTSKEQKNNVLSNLKTLCLPCHGRKDAIRRWAANVERLQQSS